MLGIGHFSTGNNNKRWDDNDDDSNNKTSTSGSLHQAPQSVYYLH